MVENTLHNKSTKTDKPSVDKKKKKAKKGLVFKMINGEFMSRDEIVQNLPFISYVGFMFVLVIAWGYYTETIGRSEVELEKELGEMNAEYFSLGSEYNRLSRQSQVAERLSQSGLKESVTPPKKIKVNTYVIK